MEYALIFSTRRACASLIYSSLKVSYTRLYKWVNNSVYSDKMVQVQLRIPEDSISEIDKWVSEGKFKSRSDAIRTILALYQEKEKTREFYKMLVEQSNEAKENPEILTLLEDLDEL